VESFISNDLCDVERGTRTLERVGKRRVLPFVPSVGNFRTDLTRDIVVNDL